MSAARRDVAAPRYVEQTAVVGNADDHLLGRIGRRQNVAVAGIYSEAMTVSGPSQRAGCPPRRLRCGSTW